MSLTATVTSQALSEWVRVFPKQVTETYTSSVTFMKQLTIVAVSTISYLKNVFPEESYTVENFGGVKLRILKKKCRDELAQFVSTALTQAFEAFEKKYLHKLALCFYDGECNIDNLMEYHVFEYSYTPAGVTMDVTSKGRDSAHSAKYSFDSVRDRTLQLIRSCVVVMQTFENQLTLPYDVSLRLYYNDDAPDGYQAPGFLSAAAGEEHLHGDAPLRLGAVRTPFHRLQASTYMRDAMRSSREAQASQNAPMMTQNDGDILNSQEMSYERSETESSVGRVVCPCAKYEGDGELMLTCEYCGTLQHAACFGRLGAVARHCCVRCSDAAPARAPTDPRLAQLTPKKRECLCILRRTLAWCGTRATVCVREVQLAFELTHVNAIKLLKLLQSTGVLEDIDTDIMSPRKIIPEQLSCVMGRYFEIEECGLADRLLAETLSQGSHSDPLGDVLGPMEKVTLQNATTIGKIIDPSPQDTVIEDATLKQYKEVILSNRQSEELPLSGNHNPVKDMDTIGKKTGKRKADKENVRAGVKTKRAKSNN